MNKEMTALLDSMVEGFIGDVAYEFELDTDEQAAKLIKQSMERVVSK